MSGTLITCRKCNHTWFSRVPNPVKCPECGYPTGIGVPVAFREAAVLSPSRDDLTESGIHQGILASFAPDLPAQLWKLTPEEQQKWEDEEAEKAREKVKALIRDARNRRDSQIYVGVIHLKGYQGVLGDRQDFHFQIARIPNETRLNRLQAGRNVEIDLLDWLQESSEKLPAELKQLEEDWKKEDKENVAEAGHDTFDVAEQRRLHREVESERFRERIELIREAVPLVQRLIAAYDQQIEIRLELLADGRKLAEMLKPIEQAAYPLAEKYRLIVRDSATVLILDYPEKCKDVAKQLQPLRKKLNELEEKYRPIASKLQVEYSQVGLAGFPTLPRLDSRIERWLA